MEKFKDCLQNGKISEFHDFSNVIDLIDFDINDAKIYLTLLQEKDYEWRLNRSVYMFDPQYSHKKLTAKESVLVVLCDIISKEYGPDWLAF